MIINKLLFGISIIYLLQQEANSLLLEHTLHRIEAESNLYIQNIDFY